MNLIWFFGTFKLNQESIINEQCQLSIKRWTFNSKVKFLIDFEKWILIIKDFCTSSQSKGNKTIFELILKIEKTLKQLKYYCIKRTVH